MRARNLPSRARPRPNPATSGPQRSRRRRRWPGRCGDHPQVEELSSQQAPAFTVHEILAILG